MIKRNNLKTGGVKMDELVKLVSKKTGISEALAKQAVEVVLDFLKKKLPAPLAGQIDSVLSGSNPLAGVGKMFG
jgi:hypothetical protein